MLNKVEVRNTAGQLLSLPFSSILSGFLVKEITGLEPVKATLVSASQAQMDGELYQASRREKRNIVIKIKLDPYDWGTTEVGALRSSLYNFFMPKTPVYLKFFDTTKSPVEISGVIETFEAPLFVKDPEAVVSIVCFNPDFVDPTEVSISGSTTSGSTETAHTYDGTIETGIHFQLLPNRSVSEFEILFRSPDNTVASLAFAAALLNGDILDIRTTPGSKSAMLTRAGLTSSILYGISPYSAWVALFPGANNIRVHADGAAIPYTIAYTKKYGGL